MHLHRHFLGILATNTIKEVYLEHLRIASLSLEDLITNRNEGNHYEPSLSFSVGFRRKTYQMHSLHCLLEMTVLFLGHCD